MIESQDSIAKELQRTLSLSVDSDNDAPMGKEPIRELTPSDNLETVKMVINQIIKSFNKTLR